MGEGKQLDVLEPQARMAKLNSLTDEKMETLLVKRGGGGAISLGVPVEAGVSALRIYIEGAVEHAVLYPPNDAPQIDLYNQTSVALYSRGSRTDGLSPRDVYLAFTGEDSLSVLPVSTRSPATAGVWHFSMRCDTCDYRLTIGATASIHFTTSLLDGDGIRLRVVGPVSTVRDSALVDEYGAELSKLTFSYQPAAGEGEHPRPGQQDQELVAEVPLPAVKASRVYAKIVGRDVHGESFVRLSGPLHQASEIRTGRSATVVFPDAFSELEMAEEYSQRGQRQMQYNETGGRTTSQVVNQLGTLMTTVQIGLSSRLYGAPGEIFAIHYEVTNYRDQGVQFSFGAGDELSYLLDVKPRYQYVASGQSVIVIVRMIISNAATPGARDLVVFTAEGRDKASIAAYVYVTSPDGPPTDLWAPEVTHSFQGSCFGKMGDDCAQNVWSVNVVARDNVAGLLRVSSSPPGLLYAGNFVAGTRDSVVSTYRASCCAPRLLVTAVDAVGNAQSYNLDISNYFTPASIAAIVLGVFLLIALILIVAFLIYWCVRRRRESKELPYTARREIG
ncbi:uncharacterized protein LOC105390047 isoform X3 [Plutella xylostella]|uniref:uncharacterized protein LOC105390047 isoform X1 n=1 Tax=Plutella xylostella TaxID=51655 RepID=UPI0020327352|nr:uncharacterized protein LOC105390047 isoform X1 [Plutella xylostella]XP_048480070.1 uncharacterized protein LOC105390047 isoform X2 [Plutella xylostella]XP_048480071.1 uncharacterized protein LOC105390047 isoform X3 [Plutella xylostella]